MRACAHVCVRACAYVCACVRACVRMGGLRTEPRHPREPDVADVLSSPCLIEPSGSEGNSADVDGAD